MEELGASDAAPDAFIDPISKELMRDPVTTADGELAPKQDGDARSHFPSGGGAGGVGDGAWQPWWLRPCPMHAYA